MMRQAQALASDGAVMLHRKHELQLPLDYSGMKGVFV